MLHHTLVQLFELLLHLQIKLVQQFWMIIWYGAFHSHYFLKDRKLSYFENRGTPVDHSLRELMKTNNNLKHFELFDRRAVGVNGV